LERNYSLRFHGFTSGIRIWRVLDMVLGTFCKEIVDDGMSQWRGDVMNVESNGLPEKLLPHTLSIIEIVAGE